MTSKKIRFGSNEEFQYIKEHLGDEKAYLHIFNLISSDTKLVLASKVYLEEYELDEVISDVQIKMNKYLVTYVEKYDNSEEEQRNKFFKKMVYNTAIDFIRSRNTRARREIELNEELGLTYSSKDLLDGIIEKNNTVKLLENGIESLTQINTSIKNIIAFLLMKISSVETNSRQSGFPKEVAKMLNGKTLFEAYDILILKISEYLDKSVVEKVLSSIHNKLLEKKEGDLVGNELISFTSTQVSNVTNRIKDKMQEYSMEDAYDR